MEIIDYQCIDYKHRHLTGYFRDGIRRVDLVLVVRNTKREEVETLKLTFLMNMINAGLQLEIENGTTKAHKDLTFIKVHGPEAIINHFGFYFDVTKYFRVGHLDRIHEFVRGERDLVKLVRESYPPPTHYSTQERSLIVYRMLQSITFGEYSNYVGIHKLLERKMIVDVYPLHDGPYFLVRRQKPTLVNGRQALMLNWVGLRNFCRRQPIHLIRDYLGERMAFLFSFYEYFNIMLFFVSVGGIVAYIFNLDISGRSRIIRSAFYDSEINHRASHKRTTGEEIAGKSFRYLPLCPKCGDFVGCPIRLMKDYRLEVAIKTRLDNPYNIFYSFYAIFIGMLLFCLWRRKEAYLYWLWEVRHDEAREMRRPEYRDIRPVSKGLRVKLRNFKGLSVFLHRIKLNQLLRGIVQFIFVAAFLSLYLFLLLPSLIRFQLKMLNRLRYVEEALPKTTERPFKMNHIALFTLSIVNALLIVVLEKVWFTVARFLALYANPRTERQYEKSMVTNLFTYSFIVNFGLIYFFAFIKGALYMIPFEKNRYSLPLELGSMNCGMLTCLEEIFIVYVATFRFKLYFKEFISILRSCHNKNDVPQHTDAEFGAIPCWEREYALQPLNEDFVMNVYHDIMIDFGASLLFITVFPFAPLVFFFVNSFKIRRLAKVVLVHSRRPMLQQNWGLGSWRQILFMMPFIIAITHALHMALNSHTLDRNFDARHYKHRDNRRFFADHFLSVYNISDFCHYVKGDYYPKLMRYHVEFYMDFVNLYCNFEKKHFPEISVPKGETLLKAIEGTRLSFSFYSYVKWDVNKCMFPRHYKRLIALSGSKHFVLDNTYTAEPVHYYLLWYRTMFIALFEALIVLVGFLLHYCIRPVSRQVENLAYVENYVTEYHGRKGKAKTS